MSRVEIPPQAPNGIKLFFYPKVHSNLQSHRSKLRELLAEILNKIDPGFPAPSDLNDLNKIPFVPGKGISLSHSPRGSAILISAKPYKVGVDVEKAERISERVLARISSLNEMDGTPATADLFTAKEAAWKAINSQYETPTISHIETFQWISLSPPWHQYYVMVNGERVPGVGFSGYFGEIYLSFFVSPSTFI